MADVVYSGWLEKRGLVNTGWKKRYLQLTRESLKYFQKQEDTVPKGQIVLAGAAVTVTEGGTVLHITSPHQQGRTYQLRGSKEEVTAWLSAIQSLGSSPAPAAPVAAPAPPPATAPEAHSAAAPTEVHAAPAAPAEVTSVPVVEAASASGDVQAEAKVEAGTAVAASAAPQILDVTCGCSCKAVEFTCKGPVIFNVMCHCRACALGAGAGPVHLIGIPKDAITVTKGKETVRESPASPQAERYFCGACGTSLYIGPRAMNFYGTSPAVYLNTTRPLPAELQFKAHINYESRFTDITDNLPKFIGFVHENRPCNNDGSPKV